MSLYTISRAQVTEIYVATFDRAPDTYGLIYWTEQSGLTIEQIAESFFSQPETQAMYPPTMNSTVFVNKIYNNVFDRDADSAGLAYWVNALDSGSIDRSDMIIAIINGATGTDQILLDNKTEVGLYFAQNGERLTLDDAYEIMRDVTVVVSSVTDALQQVDIWVESTPTPIPPAPTMDLTTAIDIIEGSDIDSTINGLVDTALPENTTLNAGDIIDGGGGNDILKVVVTGDTDTDTTIAHMSNVEELIINNTATADQAFDLSGTSGLESIVITSSGNMTFTSSEAGSAKMIDGSASTGNLTIRAGVIDTSGATVSGGSGDDTILASSGTAGSAFTITGNAGVDSMTAGAGEDTFKFANTGDTGITLETADSIISFATGTDKISFEALAAGSASNFNMAAEGATSFDAAKTAADDAFTADPGMVVYSYQYVGNDGYLFVDSDGEGTADEVVILDGLGANGIAFGDII